MSNFIPNVIEPYPDELLYSWVMRLAKANGLSLKLFCDTYFPQKNTKQEVPIDIRAGYQDFYNALASDIDMMDLYFMLSTMKFELSFHPPRQQIKVLHNVIRKENRLNHTFTSFIYEPKACPECIKEDIEKYGEPYIHRSHQLSGVVACHKHHVPLYSFAKTYRHKDGYRYDLKSTTDKICDVTDYDYRYAEYAYELLKNKISSNSDDILLVITNKIKERLNKDTISKTEIILNLVELLDNPLKEETLKRNIFLSTQETIKILMQLFPDINDFLYRLPYYEVVIKKHCDICNRDYYTTNQAIKDGWECVYCDDKIDERKLLKRLVRNIGNNQLTLKDIIFTNKKKLVIYHKKSNSEFAVNVNRFLFKNVKYRCTTKITKKEAEIKMKKHKDFELIDFKSTFEPAKIYHKVCGQTFELSSFELFLRNPKCRCCEIHQSITIEIFKQKVKDLVGDEYEVLSDIYGLHDKVEIRHNKCGKIKTYIVYQFLIGSRCSNCHVKMTPRRINIMLDDYSNGRYEVIGSHKNLLIILDNKEQKEILLSGKHIAQELLRPTPSSILEISTMKENREQISSWDTWYRLCVEYRNEFGHLTLQMYEKYRGYALWYWCSEQRKAYKRGELTDEQIQKLKDVDFIFDIILYNWNKKFEKYKEFVKDTGILLPSRDVVYDGFKVGNWVHDQRTQRHRGRIKPTHEKLLLEFNPDFFNRIKG